MLNRKKDVVASGIHKKNHTNIVRGQNLTPLNVNPVIIIIVRLTSLFYSVPERRLH